MTHGIPELGDVGGLGLGRTTGAVLHQKNYGDDPHAVSMQFVFDTSGVKDIKPNKEEYNAIF